MRVAWITVMLLMLASCGTEKVRQEFDDTKFDNSKYNFFLAFDLSSDNQPKAALIIKSGIPEGHYTTNIHLRAQDISHSEKLFSTVGQYDDYLLVDFDISSSMPAVSSISFLPFLKNVDDAEIINYGYQERAYLLKRGLERHFIFNYEEGASFKTLASASRTLSGLKPESISVSLPEGAKGIEIGNTRKTSSPDSVYVENDVYFYSYSKPATGEKQLKIKYMIKETREQEMVVDGLIKLILVLIPSGFALLLIQAKEIVNPTIRRYGLIFCGILVILAIGGLLFYSFFVDDSTAQKSFVDIGIAFIAGAFAYIVFLVKNNKS